ncbi:hypothetical protein T439DRAFT_131441 [Meredithblackwellia eburnea MCA 4105]
MPVKLAKLLEGNYETSIPEWPVNRNSPLIWHRDLETLYSSISPETWLPLIEAHSKDIQELEAAWESRKLGFNHPCMEFNFENCSTLCIIFGVNIIEPVKLLFKVHNDGKVLRKCLLSIKVRNYAQLGLYWARNAWFNSKKAELGWSSTDEEILALLGGPTFPAPCPPSPLHSNDTRPELPFFKLHFIG